jgi:Sortase domain
VTRPMADRSARRAGARTALPAVLLAGLLAGVVGCSAPPTTQADAAGLAGSATAHVAARTKPVALDVPKIGVHTTGLVDLGLTRAGALEVPKDAVTAGWYRLGPVPGEPGPAVIAAHVNYAKVPGVFSRLHETAVGDTATVTRADGRTVKFTVYRVERFPKDAFPTKDVYGNTDGPELRLVTCGGDFDRAAHSYRDNIVVYARLA